MAKPKNSMKKPKGTVAKKAPGKGTTAKKAPAKGKKPLASAKKKSAKAKTPMVVALGS